MRTESLKGQPCIYKPITCSEGYCQDCQIYLDRGKYDLRTRKELDDFNAYKDAYLSKIRG